MTDAQLNFKSACLNLKETNFAENAEANTQEMDFALKILQTEHNIDRFHFKCAVALPSKNQIVCMCRGRVKDMKE